METDDELCDVDVVGVGGSHADVDEIMMDSMFELSAYEGIDYEEGDESDDNNDANVYEAAATAPANQGDWTYLTGDAVQQHPVVNISIDGFDQQLLAKAREEVPLVLEKIKKSSLACGAQYEYRFSGTFLAGVPGSTIPGIHESLHQLKRYF